MIHYSLKCANGHDFDSWFASAAGFDALVGAGMVTCAVCGSTDVTKALMAPTVKTAKAPDRPLSTPQTEAETAIAALRREIEENSEYVGMSFAAQARAIHDGTAPERAIYGEARPAEALKLLEDGIPVAPLPFAPRKRAN